MIVKSEKVVAIPNVQVMCDFCLKMNPPRSTDCVNGSRGCFRCHRHMCNAHSHYVERPGDFPDMGIRLCMYCYPASRIYLDALADELKRHEAEEERLEADWMQVCDEVLRRTK